MHEIDVIVSYLPVSLSRFASSFDFDIAPFPYLSEC
jgi:hypothetical protein